MHSELHLFCNLVSFVNGASKHRKAQKRTCTANCNCFGGGTQPAKLVGFHAFAIAGSKPRKGGME